MKLVASSTDGQHIGPSEDASRAVGALTDVSTIEEELDAMISDIKNASLDLPDEMIGLCAAYMARCTEIHVRLIRVGSRAANFLRTQQLAKVMELLEFSYRAASRIVEIRRQESELSR